MTNKQQRWFNTALWPNACRANGWSPSDRANKLRVVGEIIGREIATTKDVGWGKEFDTLKNELQLLANPTDLNAALRTVDGGASDQRKRWLHKLQDFQPSYVAALVKSFSRGATLNPADLDDAKLKAVVVTVEERARIKPELRLANQSACHSEPVEESPSTDDVPFTNQF